MPVYTTLSSAAISNAKHHQLLHPHEFHKPHMAYSNPFLNIVKSRRTVYDLNKNIPISIDRLDQIFWGTAKGVMRGQLGETKYIEMKTEQRLQKFQHAYGTALFFEDPAPKKDFQGRFKAYAQHFDEWSHQGSGMAQYVLWATLWTEGCGCNLQHFNPIVDVPVKAQWNIDEEWRLVAQLVSGGKKEGWEEDLRKRVDYYEAGEKYFIKHSYDYGCQN